MQFIVISLIGIPASSKTSLAKRIVDLSKNGALPTSAIVISFDDHLKVDFNNLHNGKYKYMREELVNNVENIIRRLLNNEKHKWDDILTSNGLKIQGNNFYLKADEPTLVIFDDNNYFRSMRQRNRALCRSLQCQHFQIFMKSTLDESKRRNMSRDCQVPESIIEKMFDKLETPKNPRTIIIESVIDDQTLVQLLLDRIKNPETFIEVEKAQQRQSIIHELDIVTRKELSKKLQSLRSRDISSYCDALNRRRKQFLEDIKNKENLDDVETLRQAFLCYLCRSPVNFS